MLRSFSSSCNERKVDVCCCCGRKLFLCFLCSFFQTLHCHLVTGKINAFCFLEFIDHPLCDTVIKIIATKMCITVCRQYFDNAVTDLNDRYIECTTTQIVYHDLLLFFIVKTISKCCCGRLVDDTFYIKTCDLTCIFGCLTLCVIEVSRYCDDCF